LLLNPVAKSNLQEYLDVDPFPFNHRSVLWRAFGCLTSALFYLHRSYIRHRDLKPSNILVDGSNVLLTDFGTALNWTEDGGSTSVDAPGTLTWQYCSPEQASHGERGRPSDVWSLGCIFLEITAVLMGYHVSDMYTYFRTSGSGQRFVRTNLEALSAWLTRLQVNPRISCKSSSMCGFRGCCKLTRQSDPPPSSCFTRSPIVNSLIFSVKIVDLSLPVTSPASAKV